MKMNFTGKIITVVLGGALTACTSMDPPPKNDHYILIYDDPQAMYMQMQESRERPFYISLYTPCASHTEAIPCQNLISKYTEPERYEELAMRFNDTSRPDHWWESMLYVMFVPTESLDVVSDADFDAAHPAGALLNEYWEIEYSCADRFLALGGEYDSSKEPNAVGYNNRFIDPLPVFNEKKMTLMPLMFLLSLTDFPQQRGVHRFTFTYRNAEGKVLTVTTEPIEVPGRN